MKTFDDSPPAVATSTMGVGRAACKTTHAELPTMRIQLHYDVPWHQLSAIEHNILAMPAKHKAAWLLRKRVACMADQPKHNALEPSMYKAGVVSTVTLIQQKGSRITRPLDARITYLWKSGCATEK